jgi:hypothetical protein
MHSPCKNQLHTIRSKHLEMVLYYNQQMHSFIIKVYITTVSLHNLYYLFQHFCVIIRELTTNALLGYTYSSNCSTCVTEQGVGCMYTL